MTFYLFSPASTLMVETLYKCNVECNVNLINFSAPHKSHVRETNLIFGATKWSGWDRQCNFGNRQKSSERWTGSQREWKKRKAEGTLAGDIKQIHSVLIVTCFVTWHLQTLRPHFDGLHGIRYTIYRRFSSTRSCLFGRFQLLYTMNQINKSLFTVNFTYKSI